MLKASKTAGIGCLMLSQPSAVTPTLWGGTPSGFGSTHHPETSLASGQRAAWCWVTFSLPRDIPAEVPLLRNTKPWLFGWKDKGFLHFFWGGYLLSAHVLTHNLGMEVQAVAGDQGMVCTGCQT